MAESTDWYDDFIRDESEEEEIVDLTDIVDKQDEANDDDGIIELSEVVENQDPKIELNNIKNEDPGIPVLEKEIPYSDGLGPHKGETEKMSVPEPGADAVHGLGGANISQEQLEAALERVIERKFADRIEGLLLEGTEKMIRKEIAEIKERVLNNLHQMENG